MITIAIILLCVVGPFLIVDFNARRHFIALAYCRRRGHGKSWKRAIKHYKSNWSLWQRLLWIPLFKEEYEKDIMILPYLAYIHVFLAIAETIICILIDGHPYQEKVYLYTLPVCIVFWSLRELYTELLPKFYKRDN